MFKFSIYSFIIILFSCFILLIKISLIVNKNWFFVMRILIFSLFNLKIGDLSFKFYFEITLEKKFFI